MFLASEFTYAGVPASMFGLFIVDIGSKVHTDNQFGNKANIVETRIARRVRPLHFGVRYHDEPLKFTIIFCGEEPMDRFQLQEVSKWLTGYQDYQWLTIDQPDLEHVRFRCLIQSLTPISVGWYPVGFEAQVVCDCPYGYSYPFRQTFVVQGEKPFWFHNYSTAREKLKPMLYLSISPGCTEFRARNLTASHELVLSGLPAGGCSITIDNENEVITSDTGTDLYEGFNNQFFFLVPGDNQIIFSGNGEVKLEGMYLYNTGA